MQATDHPSVGRTVVIAGFVLIVIGSSALISQLFPEYDRYLPLAVGIGMAAAFAITRNYLALVFAGILTGLGVGLVAAQAFPSTQADGAGAVLGLGFGFLSIWVTSRLMALPQHHFWPLIPGLILVAVGSALAADAFTSSLGQLVVPAVVLAVGALFVIAGLIAGRGAAEGSSTE